jgi:hypothetical protein
MIWGGGPGGVKLPAETYEYLNLCGRQGKKNPAWKKNFWYLMLENDLSFFPMVFEFYQWSKSKSVVFLGILQYLLDRAFFPGQHFFFSHSAFEGSIKAEKREPKSCLG